jgi:hypothetical protein
VFEVDAESVDGIEASYGIDMGAPLTSALLARSSSDVSHITTDDEDDLVVFAHATCCEITSQVHGEQRHVG